MDRRAARGSSIGFAIQLRRQSGAREMNRVDIAQVPNIYFNSDIDSPFEWREALATPFEKFSFSTDAGPSDPSSVNIALVWKLPEGGLAGHFSLRSSAQSYQPRAAPSFR